MLCENCQHPILLAEGFIDENVNEAEATTSIQRGFCLNCGRVYRPNHSTYILAVYNLMSPNQNTFSILENGDTFSQVWVTIPIYRQIFQTAHGKFALRILSKTIEQPFENKVHYETVYEEVLESIPPSTEKH